MTDRERKLVEAWLRAIGVESHVTADTMLEMMEARTGKTPADIAESLFRTCQEENE